MTPPPDERPDGPQLPPLPPERRLSDPHAIVDRILANEARASAGAKRRRGHWLREIGVAAAVAAVVLGIAVGILRWQHRAQIDVAVQPTVSASATPTLTAPATPTPTATPRPTAGSTAETIKPTLRPTAQRPTSTTTAPARTPPAATPGPTTPPTTAPPVMSLPSTTPPATTPPASASVSGLLALGTSQKFRYFTVTVSGIERSEAQGYLVKATVCVNELPPDPQGDATQISWQAWSVSTEGANVPASLADGSHPPTGLFPAKAVYRVGECATGWIPFAGVTDAAAVASIDYANFVDDKARWTPNS